MEPEYNVPAILLQYNLYLKQKYKRLRMPLDDQWPPVQASDYVPLVLSLSDLSDFSEEVVTKKINKILKGHLNHVSNNLIQFSDIFEGGNGDSVNSILVQGSPGIGKTAFSLTVCKKWATGELFSQFQITILWALRDPHIQNFSSIDDLFFHDSSEVSAAVVKEVRQSGGKGVLFVFDGWDELPEKFTKSRNSCFFLDLIKGNELPFSSVIVTSRNISSQRFLRHSLFNRTIDILGFSPEYINEYISKCFSKRPKDEIQLKQLLTERPDIMSISYVPMNCSIVCYVFNCKKTLPATLTELYDLLAKNSLLRNFDLRGQSSEDIADCHSLPDEISSFYLSLCKLAYHGLSISRYTYSRDDIVAVCKASTAGVVVDVDKLGVLQAVNVFHSEGVSSSFHFLHTTVQEFMAASYISSLNQEELRTVVTHHFATISFKMVWQFYCGLLRHTNPMKNIFVEKLLEEVNIAAGIDTGFHDSFSNSSSNEELFSNTSDESIEDEIIEEEVMSDSEELTLEVDLKNDEGFQSPEHFVTESAANEVLYESTAASATLSQSPPTKYQDLPPPSTTLCLTSGTDNKDIPLVTDGGLEGIPSTLSNITAEFVSNVNQYKHDKAQILFTLRCVYETQYQVLCSKLCDILCSHLFFYNLSINPGDINAIGFVLAKSNRKWQLNLANCNLNMNHLIMLRHHLLKNRCHGKVMRLYLTGNELDYESIKVLVEMLSALKPLEKVFLGSNKLSDESIENGYIPELLKGLSSLCSLSIASNGITDLGLKPLMKSVTFLSHLSHLDISHNSISPKGAIFIAEVVSTVTTLQYLNIGNNHIEDEGIQTLSASLHQSSLEYLNLSNVGASDEGIVVLASALQCNFSLQTLILRSNNAITCEGIGILFTLCGNSKIRSIDLSLCEAGWNDALLVAFGDSIPHFASLESLDLSFNEFEDEGISALINSISCCSHITKLGLGGNGMSPETLLLLGYMICENATLKKISLYEEDLAIDSETFDEFCDCVITSNSLEIIDINEVENEKLLKEKFKHVNNCRKTFTKEKIKVIYNSA